MTAFTKTGSLAVLSIPPQPETQDFEICDGEIIVRSTGSPLLLTTGRSLDQPSPVAAYMAVLSPGSHRTMRQILDLVAGLFSRGVLNADTFDWSVLRRLHLLALRMYLQWRISKEEGDPLKLSPRTANKMMTAVRQALKQAYLLNQIPERDYRQALQIPEFKFRPKAAAAGRALNADEVRALMAVCVQDSSKAGIRDAAIIALMCQAGLRRSEVIRLNLTDYDSETGCFTIQHSKGGETRTVYVSGGAARAIEIWRQERFRISREGPFFLPISRGGNILRQRRMAGAADPMSTRLSDQAIYEILRKRGEQAGIHPNFSPHDLRRTFITELLDATGDVNLAADIAGHKNTNTTRSYDRRGEAAKRRAASLIHIPYDPPAPPRMPSEFGPEETPDQPNGTRIAKIHLRLRVQGHSKFVRGEKKARQSIERFVLSQYEMEQPYPNSHEYTLYIPYETDEELDKQVYDLLKEADDIADSRHCFIEADTYTLDGSGRRW